MVVETSNSHAVTRVRQAVAPDAEATAWRKTIRICVTGLRGMPDVMGGVESHCEELLPRIAALAPELEFEVLARRPYVGSEARTFRGIRITPLAAPRRQSSEALISTLVGALHARRNRARFLHIHAIGPALVAPLARLLGLKVVMTHHGADYDRAKWGPLAKFMLRLGEKWGIASAEQVIAVSPSLRESLAARYPARADRITYIPNGVPRLDEDGQSSAEFLRSMGLEAGRYILAVGRLVPEKGFDYLIEAYKRSGTDRKLAIAGASDHETAFSKSILGHADERVLFLGQQPRSAIRHLYKGADLFVLPSFHEGLPISALEAAWCDAPMLLSDIRPNLDLGLPPKNYFPVGDADALAERLAMPGHTFAIDGAAVRQRFDWDEIAIRTLAVYRQLM